MTKKSGTRKIRASTRSMINSAVCECFMHWMGLPGWRYAHKPHTPGRWSVKGGLASGPVISCRQRQHGPANLYISMFHDCRG